MYSEMFLNPWKPLLDLSGACLEYYSELGKNLCKFAMEVQHLETMKFRERPVWYDLNEIVLETEAFCLRRFSEGTSGEAVIMIPPNAGHPGTLLSFGFKQSIVGAFVENSPNPVYVIDPKSADWSRAGESLDDLILQTDACVDYVGGRPHLAGFCQGGWQSTIYAAMFPEKISSLYEGGAPNDFWGDGGKIYNLVMTYPMEFFKGLVFSGGGVLWGGYMIAGFKDLNSFDRYVKKYADLYKNINDQKELARSRRFVRWFDYPWHCIAGTWYLQAVKQLFKENRLIQGELEILGRKVDPGDIKCPGTFVAGEYDDITPPPQQLNLAKYISTPKSQIETIVIPKCGHIGLFMSHRAIEEYWAPLVRRHAGMKTRLAA